MYERFTDRARKTMQLANQEAQRFNHNYIGTEHVLLGLVKEGSGVAATVLDGMDICIREVRLEVEKLVQSGPDGITMGKLPLTPRAKKVIEHAFEESRNLHHNYVGTEHLLLGLLREEEGVASQVLRNLGATLKHARLRVKCLLAGREQGSGEPSLDVSRLFTFVTVGTCGGDDEINWIPVKSDKPDGWPRTKDGHLVKPGMDVWSHNSLGTIRSIYQDDDPNRGGVWVGLVDAAGNIEGCASIGDCYAVKPEEPATAESVLRGLYDVLTNKGESFIIGRPLLDREQKLRSLLSAAEKVLGMPQQGSGS